MEEGSLAVSRMCGRSTYNNLNTIIIIISNDDNHNSNSSNNNNANHDSNDNGAGAVWRRDLVSRGQMKKGGSLPDSRVAEQFS